MSDEALSMPIANLYVSHRLTDAIHPIIEAAVSIYAERGLQWELLPGPIPGPNGQVQIGAFFAMWMPTPLLDDSKFYVNNMFPDVTVFTGADNVKQIVFDFVETLRQAKAEWSKGSN